MLNRLFAGMMNIDGFSVQNFPATIGRGEDVSIQVGDRFVSRVQCEIDIIDGLAVVTDLGSHHGTFVNGKRVTELAIESGDILRLGLKAYVVNRVGDKLFFRAISSYFEDLIETPASVEQMI